MGVRLPFLIIKTAEALPFEAFCISYKREIEVHENLRATFLFANRIIYLLEGPRTCRFLSRASENF